MKFLNKMFILFFIFGVFSGLHASISTKLDLSKCQLIKINADQIRIYEDEMQMVDEDTGEPIVVDGFICLEESMYAIQSRNSPPSMRAFCDHPYGCNKCLGCNVHKCINYCPGCK